MLLNFFHFFQSVFLFLKRSDNSSGFLMGQLSSIDISSSCTLFLLLVCEIEFRFFYVVGELLLLAKEASN